MREFTDFTKQFLTKAFQAKGNTGSDLLEVIQPIVSVFDLENGPCPPYIPFSAGGACGPTAAQFSVMRIYANANVVEATTVIDRVLVQTGTGGHRLGISSTLTGFNTGGVVTLPIAQDGFLQSQPMNGYLTIDQGTDVSDFTFGVRLAASAANLTHDLRVLLPHQTKIPATGQGMALYLEADTVNTPMTWSVYGRVYPIGR